MKIYARQIPPEHQKSPVFHPGMFPEDIAVYGNRDYNEHCPPVFNRVYDALYNATLLDAWEDVNRGEYWHSWKQALNEIIPPEGRGEYTREERKHKIPDILYRYYNARSAEENRIICELIEIVTGEPWQTTTIRGCCQGDWQYICYPVNKWSARAVEAFETEYFNTGSEWVVHNGDSEPETPDEIDGFCCYVHAWQTEDIKKEIANAYGEPDANVILYEFSGYTKIAHYTEV